MSKWLLLPYLFSLIHVDVALKTREPCHNFNTYALPSGKVVDSGLPILTQNNSYLLINDHKYYWDENEYTPNASRPIVCSGPFESSLKIFENIFLLDDDNGNESFNEKLDRLTRPKNVFYDCEADGYCCYGQCCGPWPARAWLLVVMMGILMIIVIMIFGIMVITLCYMTYDFIQDYKRSKTAQRSSTRAPGMNQNETVAADQLRQPVSSTNAHLMQSRQPISSANAIRLDQIEANVADRLRQIRPTIPQPLSAPSAFMNVVMINEGLHAPTDDEPPPSYEEVTSSKRCKVIRTMYL